MALSLAIAGRVPITFGQIYIGAFEVCINYIGIGQVTKPQKCLNE